MCHTNTETTCTLLQCYSLVSFGTRLYLKTTLVTVYLLCLKWWKGDKCDIAGEMAQTPLGVKGSIPLLYK